MVVLPEPVPPAMPTKKGLELAIRTTLAGPFIRKRSAAAKSIAVG